MRISGFGIRNVGFEMGNLDFGIRVPFIRSIHGELMSYGPWAMS